MLVLSLGRCGDASCGLNKKALRASAFLFCTLHIVGADGLGAGAGRFTGLSAASWSEYVTAVKRGNNCDQLSADVADGSMLSKTVVLSHLTPTLIDNDDYRGLADEVRRNFSGQVQTCVGHTVAAEVPNAGASYEFLHVLRGFAGTRRHQFKTDLASNYDDPAISVYLDAHMLEASVPRGFKGALDVGVPKRARTSTPDHAAGVSTPWPSYGCVVHDTSRFRASLRSLKPTGVHAMEGPVRCRCRHPMLQVLSL